MSPPTHLWIPERVGSYGDEACDLMKLAGRELDEPQRIAVDAMLSYGPGGRWTALESAVVEPRQNGKSAAIITAVVLFDLFLLPPDQMTWTAHLFKTARGSFEDLHKLIAGCPELSRRVKKIREANGEEGFELHSGAELNFLARSKGGGRGLGGKRVVMDEALILASAPMEALMPTLAARPDPQLMYGSSAGLETSEHLHSLMQRGRAAVDPSLIWVEWKADGGWDNPPCGTKCSHAVDTPGCYLDDEDAWAQANPSLDVRITRRYVRGERRALSPRGFGRERLGWFEKLALLSLWRVISASDWNARRDPEWAGTLPTLALEFEFDRSSASVLGAALRSDGRTQVGVIEHRPGTDWVLPWATEVWSADIHPDALVVDPKGPAGPLIPALEAAGVRVVQPDLADLIAAYALFSDGCKPEHDLIRHYGDGPLDASVRDIGNRTVGDRLAWDRKGSGTAAAVAASLAAFHAAVVRRPFFATWR